MSTNKPIHLLCTTTNGNVKLHIKEIEDYFQAVNCKARIAAVIIHESDPHENVEATLSHNDGTIFHKGNKEVAITSHFIAHPD